MSKKVIVVSKTHLDLGFTDYAENVRRQYLDSFIPEAINIAKKLNNDAKKKFVWTTGSYLIHEALKEYEGEKKEELQLAIKRGDIVAHALPFTTHTEIMNERLFKHGLSFVDEIDNIRGKKTISAKMTDVPGHTIAIVPYLAKKGVKLLHIGVNDASKVPSVPDCFLWKYGDSEIVVIYSNGYGKPYISPYIDEILYFDHTHDNKGVPNENVIKSHFEKIEKNFFDYEVVAGSLDDYAECIWKVKDKLPIITSEIGDTWIHGVGTDPFKVGAYKLLLSQLEEWIENNQIQVGSVEYNNYLDNLLCIAEHTWGMDIKVNFADYTNYKRKDFEKARKINKVNKRSILGAISNIYKNICTRNSVSYTRIEKSWEEQRAYIYKAIEGLEGEKKEQVKNLVENIKSNKDISTPQNSVSVAIEEKISYKDFDFKINDLGALSDLRYKGELIVRDNNSATLRYRTYGSDDYNYFKEHYMRGINKNWIWSIADFCRPFLKHYDISYEKRNFYYEAKKIKKVENNESLKIYVDLEINRYCYVFLGASLHAKIIYTFKDNNVNIKIAFFDKPANRITESLHFDLLLSLEKESLRYIKIGQEINAYDIVEGGNRHLSAVEKVIFQKNNIQVDIKNNLSLLVGTNDANILRYNNEYYDASRQGLSYILHNNVWGTNFPLWYEGDMLFDFDMTMTEKEREY